MPPIKTLCLLVLLSQKFSAKKFAQILYLLYCPTFTKRLLKCGFIWRKLVLHQWLMIDQTTALYYVNCELLLCKLPSKVLRKLLLYAKNRQVRRRHRSIALKAQNLSLCPTLMLFYFIFFIFVFDDLSHILFYRYIIIFYDSYYHSLRFDLWSLI